MQRRTRPLKGPITDSARALRGYLTREGLTVPAFCEEAGLDRIAVQRALNGERRRFSVDFAAAIKRATDGEVRILGWLRRTARLEAGHAS